MPDQKGRSNPHIHSVDVLENMHSLFLEALRHREQEIFRYLAILVPALGGFLWLIQEDPEKEIFIIGTISVISLLSLGGIYSLALGYNYRYITLQLAKLEAILNVKDAMLVGWPRSSKDFLDRYKLFCCIPWCIPPEIIKVFWGAFLLGIFGITVTVHYYYIKPDMAARSFMIYFGPICLIITGFLFPFYFGWKLRSMCKKEPEDWV